MNTHQSLQLIGTLFLFFALLSGSWFLWFFGGFFFFLMGLNRWWNRNIHRLVKVSLHTDSTRVMPHTALPLQITVRNHSWLPLPLSSLQLVLPEHVLVVDADELTVVNKRHMVKLWMNIPRKSQVERTITITPTKRGMVWMTEVQTECSGPFAMFVSQFEMPVTFSLLVYPEVVPVPLLTMGTTQPIGSKLSKQRLQTDPTFMRGIRPYAAGDRIKHIDWKTSAKTLSLQTRQFEYTAHAEWKVVGHILPSFEARLQNYNDELNERTISLIASVATQCRRNNISYELLLSVRVRGHEFYRYPKGSGKQHHVQIMSHLSRLHHFVPTTPLSILRRLESSTSRETILLITPRLDEKLQQAVGRLVRIGHEVIILDSSQETVSYQMARAVSVIGGISS
ncbi:DUF58 domain-containing protein [Brevibacillus sp. SYSU BS000544]|uniref:DUF58 domain-containing protein n=1 Tax=Brevibacillus sp. SYSU BS000544 TaxID=3416443 RepID=UPI003CE495F1